MNQPTTPRWRLLLPVGTLALLALALPLGALPNDSEGRPLPAAPRPLAAVDDAVPGDSLASATGNTLAGLPLAFEPNVGQTDGAVDYMARRPGYTLFLAPGEAVFAFEHGAEDAARLRIALVGSDAGASAAAAEELPGRVHYLIGNDPDAWRTDIRTFAKVRYTGVYPGIDLVYYGNGRELEYDFVVAPGADPGSIRLAFEGAESVRVADDGDLVLVVDGREVRQSRPLLYQDGAAGRNEVEGGYALAGGGTVRFELGAYDPALPLVIDPVLVYSTFLGGTSADGIAEVARDNSGNVYATGETGSPNFFTKNPFDATPNGQRDVFVTKINPNLNGSASVIYSTYLGGSDLDRGSGIVVDNNNRAHVTGFTESLDWPLSNALQATKGAGGTPDGFFTRLSANGGALSVSTYLGGENNDSANSIALDPDGNVVIAGDTESATMGFAFPGTSVQTTIAGGRDGFILKLESNGQTVDFFTYFGGGVIDEIRGVHTDGDGNVYVGGFTSSSNLLNRPTETFTVIDGTGNGPEDAFAAKITPNGEDLVWATYLGGSDGERGFNIAVDGDGNAYVVGRTSSSDFPTAGTPFQGSMASDPILTTDAFVTKINAAGSALVYSTYLGGSANEEALDVAVDDCGEAYVIGDTDSPDFPTVNELEGYNALNDAFLSVLGGNGSGLAFSTYLGSTGVEQGNGVDVVNGCGQIFAGGFATNGFQPSPGTRSFDTTYNGGATDGFVLLIDFTGDTDQDQIPDLVEPDNLPSTDPETKDNDIFTADPAGNRLFAMQQFRDFVDREGLAGGISFWADALTNATATRAEVVRFFYNSAEYQNEFANVIRLALAHQQGFADQIPEFSLLQTLFDDFQGGADLFDLSADLATDPNWIARYGTGAFPNNPAGNDAFVTQVYQDLLARAPAQAGLDYWSNQLDTGIITRPDLFVFIAETTEFKNRIANEQFVVSIFTEMLQRAPAQGGFTFWVNQLDGGGSNLVLIQTILNAAEYSGRFLP